MQDTTTIPEIDLSQLRTSMLINGEWRNGSSGSTFTLHDPATGQEIARVHGRSAIEAYTECKSICSATDCVVAFEPCLAIYRARAHRKEQTRLSVFPKRSRTTKPASGHAGRRQGAHRGRPQGAGGDPGRRGVGLSGRRVPERRRGDRCRARVCLGQVRDGRQGQGAHRERVRLLP